MLLELGDARLAPLKESIRNGECSLFLGAGASIGARNQFNVDPPLGGKLTEILAAALGPEFLADADSNDLQEIYQAAMAKLGHNELVSILQSHYQSCRAGWQTILSTFVWSRIYTTNIDDVLRSVYRHDHAKQVPTFRVYSDSLTRPVDLSLDTVEVSYLHGSIEKRNVPFVFTQDQYADVTVNRSPWHIAFADDYYERVFLFVGTKLKESDLKYYVASQRRTGTSRPPAYVLVRDHNPARVLAYEESNVHFIKADSAEAFFKWLDAEIPSRLTPSQMKEALEPELGTSGAAFSKWFSRVRPSMRLETRRVEHDFYQGDQPIWRDIVDELDAPREASELIKNFVLAYGEMSKVPPVSCLTSSPGHGKTTALMRICYDLAMSGKRVYYHNGVGGLDFDVVGEVLKKIERGAVLAVDNAADHAYTIARLQRTIASNNLQIFLLTAERKNRYGYLAEVMPHGTVTEFPMEHLTDGEISEVLRKLSRNGRLGRLQNKTNAERINHFKRRAGRQLLVALKEATQGQSFSEIIKGEYRSITDQRAKKLYGAVSLCHQVTQNGLKALTLFRALGMASDDGEQLMQPGQPLNEVVKLRNNRLITRHSVIAESVCDEAMIDAAERVELMISILGELVPYLSIHAVESGIPEALVMKRFFDTAFIKRMARGNHSLVERFYQECQDGYRWNSKYWIQRALFEAQRGRYAVSVGYAQMALSLDDNPVIHTGYSQVLLQWIESGTLPEAERKVRMDEVRLILRTCIAKTSWDDRKVLDVYFHGVPKCIHKYPDLLDSDLAAEALSLLVRASQIYPDNEWAKDVDVLLTTRI